MKKIRSSRKGFTLIEMLLYVAIVAMIIFSFVSFFRMILESRVKNQTVSDVNQEGVQIINLLSQEIRNATSISDPSQGGSGGGLTIVVPDGAKSPTVVDLSGNSIRIKEGSSGAINLNSPKILASDLVVENLSRPDTPGTVRIRFTLTRENSSNRNEYKFSKTFYFSASLRNQ